MNHGTAIRRNGEPARSHALLYLQANVASFEVVGTSQSVPNSDESDLPGLVETGAVPEFSTQL